MKKGKKILLGALAFLLLALAAGTGAYLYSEYKKTPKIVVQEKQKTVDVWLTAPGESRFIKNKGIEPDSLRIIFSSPDANITLNKGEASSYVSIFPSVAGKWSWNGNSSIFFYPDKDWAPNTTYTVTLSESLFGKDVKLPSLKRQFTTPPFKGKMDETELYTDPVQPQIKKVVSRLSFSHPVSLQEVKNNLKLYWSDKTPVGFELTAEEGNRVFYILSEPIQLKIRDDFIYLELSPVQNLYNSEKTQEKIKDNLLLPGSYDFFKLEGAFSQTVENEEKDNESEQILMMEFSSPVKTKSLGEFLQVSLFPKKCSWVRRMTDDWKKAPAVPLPVRLMEQEKEASSLQMMKYEAEPDESCLRVTVLKGLVSADDLVLSETQSVLVEPSDFPKKLKISSEGALLPLAGEKVLSFTTKGIAKVEAKVARIPAASINHLVSQSYGSFEKPSFNYSFGTDDIAENFKETIPLLNAAPQKENYASLDLSKYFEEKKGLFIVSLKGFEKPDDFYSDVEDQRFILLTNLGMMVKRAQDDSFDVFVSDFVAGEPVHRVRVDVLGRNGRPVMTEYTDREGRVSFPDLSDFKNEKKPVAFVASLGDDVSFIPFSSYERELNYSSFDVGGEHSLDKDDLKALLFTDRGIYRPGETAYFGLIVRDRDLSVPVFNQLRLEVYSPSYQKVFTKIVSVPEGGMVDFSLPLGLGSATGKYTVSAAVFKKYGGGRASSGETSGYFNEIASESFIVEEFEPETMRMKVSIVGAEKEGWLTDEAAKVSVFLENLYGTAAEGHEVKGSFILTPQSFRFKKFKEYVFYDPFKDDRHRASVPLQELDGKTTDEKGLASFKIDLQEYRHGLYKLTFLAEGLAAVGGRAVTGQASAYVSPLKVLAGYKAEGDLSLLHKGAEQYIDFIAIAPDMEKVALEAPTIQLSEEKYVSVLMRQPNGTYKYQSVLSEKPVSLETVAFPAQGLRYRLNTQTPGRYVLRLNDKDGKLLCRVAYQVGGERNTAGSLEKSAFLTVQPEKKEYLPGQTLKFQVTAPYAGYGLVTIEKDRVYAAKWFKTDTLSSLQEIEVPEELEGNAYLNVAFVRDVKSDEIYMPPLSYAVASFEISNHSRRQEITLSAPQFVKPGNDLKISYKTSVPGKIILYGVNEGILNYIGYRMPDPVSVFLPKKALEVATFQTLDLILPDAGSLLKKARTGGDGGEESAVDNFMKQFLNPFARKADKPVVFWSGVLDASPEERVYTYRVPDSFNGTIKIMAVSAGDGSFGNASEDVIVRGDFALTPSVPMNVIPGDEFEVGLAVSHVADTEEALRVTAALLLPESLEFAEGSRPSLQEEIEKGREKSFRFRLRAKQTDYLEPAELVFRVSGRSSDGDFSAQRKVQMGIRPASSFGVYFKSGIATDGKVKLKGFNLPMYRQFSEKRLTASLSPLMLVPNIASYLKEYPYGCSEQTVSKIFPLMAVFFEMQDFLPQGEVYRLFDEAVSILQKRQMLSGGLSMWTGGMTEDKYASIYAYHFLSYAAKKGFNVPSDLMGRLKSYVKKIAAEKSSLPYERGYSAYAIYVLTLDGEVTTNYLINLESQLDKEEKGWKDTLTGAYVAASYALLQDAEKAQAYLGQYNIGQNPNLDTQLLFLLAKHFPDRFNKVYEQAVQVLMEPLQSGYLNTKYASFAILALSALPENSDMPVQEVVFSKGVVKGNKFNYVDFTEEDAFDEVVLTAEKPFFYVIRQEGFLREPVSKPISEKLEISKTFLNEKGEEISDRDFTLGEEITVVLKIRTTEGKSSYIKDVALVDLLPGCFEIVSQSVKGENSYTVKAVEPREDRVIVHLDASPSLKEISYKVRVTAKGKFVLPAAAAQALYEADARASTAAGMVTVK